MRFLYLLFACLLGQTLIAQNLPAYQIYRADGTVTDYETMVQTLLQNEVVCFGELHDNPISHWLQLEVTKALHDTKGKDLVLGAEMFEADNQLLMNEYLQDQIRLKDFESESRLWPNYETDYKPLVEFAHDHQLHFVATNIPRRYSALVFRKGPTVVKTLDKTAQSYIAPLPITYNLELDCYKSIGEMMQGHKGTYIAHAQAIKDATMAHFILENRGKNQLFLHYNGAYHSDNHESIVWYLKQKHSKLKVVTISTVFSKINWCIGR